jgi:hypothetical protein
MFCYFLAVLEAQGRAFVNSFISAQQPLRVAASNKSRSHRNVLAVTSSFSSVAKGQSAIRDLFAVRHDHAGNLPPLPAVFPDQMPPIVRAGADGKRELVMAAAACRGPHGSAAHR